METTYWSRALNTKIGRRRVLAVTGGTSLAAALLAACGGSSSSSGSSGGGAASGNVTPPVDTSKSAKRGGALKLYHFNDVQGFDPGFANLPNEYVRSHVYSFMTQYEPGYLQPSAYKVIPDLAQSWEFSGDGLTLTMKMRPGVSWHNKAPVNGRAFDMDDVLFAWNRVATRGTNRTDLFNASNPDAPILSYGATDSQTFQIKLKYPTSYLLAITAYQTGILPMVPKETDSTFNINADQIGTGPFFLQNYTPSVGFTYKRFDKYYNKDFPIVDTVELPIIPDYQAQISQFRAGNIYTMSLNSAGLKAEDVIITKRDVPQLNLFKGLYVVDGSHTAFGWLPSGKSPWLDERVRQAYSMTWDRDAYLDVWYNVSKFKAQGLAVDVRWNTALNGANYDGWIDPRDKNFGPNAKYFQRDIAEAKKLLSAAGYPSGLEYISTFPSGNSYGRDFPSQLQTLEGFAQDAGFRAKENPIDYVSEFIPKYRNGKGQSEGVAYKIGPGYAYDATARMVYEYYSKGGINFYGFDAAGKGDGSGDPQVDSLIEKARSELDSTRRNAIVQDIQRYLAAKMYVVSWPGGGNTFELAWPAMGNYGVYYNTNFAPSTYWWVDDTKPPIKNA